MRIELAKEWHFYRLIDAHRVVATKNCRASFTARQTVKVTERRIPLE